MRFSLRQLCGLGLALISLSAAAQNSLAERLVTASFNLRILNRNSGCIFVGTVLSVERVAPTEASGVATVQITFQVEQWIRGSQDGQVLAIREWAGLWNSGERYRRGERLLLFLYAPSKLGLTSPVGGPLGRFPVDSGGNVVLDDGRFSSLALAPPARARLPGKNSVKARALALAIARSDAE